MSASLNSRLLLAASVGLLSFLGLAGLALDEAFRSRSVSAVENRLQGQVFGLLAAADLDPEGRLAPLEELPEPRFSRIDSGLYAQVTDAGGDILWRSPSAVNKQFPEVEQFPDAGEALFSRIEMDDGGSVFLYRFGVTWEFAAQRSVPLLFSVAEDVRGYEKEVGAFRRTLWFWLGGAALVLLAIQAFTLRWSLRPLTEAATEVEQVERGERSRLSRAHPREIAALTDNVNTLLDNERAQRTRYRNAMDDLAHSIKTPLAVLRGWLDGITGGVDTSEAELQVERIRQIVDHQLRRAISGGPTFARPVPVRGCLEQVLSALRKVYHDKSVEMTVDCDPELVFFGDQGDLMETFGNILDNAFKYCRSKVSVRCGAIPGEKRSGLDIVVADDGPGIEQGQGDVLMERGARADRRTAGQGIGLATVRDIVDAYGGRLSVESAGPSGGRVGVRFPPA